MGAAVAECVDSTGEIKSNARTLSRVLPSENSTRQSRRTIRANSTSGRTCSGVMLRSRTTPAPEHTFADPVNVAGRDFAAVIKAAM